MDWGRLFEILPDIFIILMCFKMLKVLEKVERWIDKH
jgi:hypothetical protein